MSVELNTLAGGHADDLGSDHEQSSAAKDVNNVASSATWLFEIVGLEQDQRGLDVPGVG